LGRTPDHDDAVEETALSSAYDITARAWKARFGVPYSVCGCAPDPIQSNTFSKLASKIFKPDAAKRETSAELKNERPDLVSAEEADADATHPSEHNSVLVMGYKFGEAIKKVRTAQVDRRVKDATKQRQKNEEKQRTTTWTDIQIRNRENARANHVEAYSAMYPYPGLYPFGVYGSGCHLPLALQLTRLYKRVYGGCAAYGGALVASGGVGGCASVSNDGSGYTFLNPLIIRTHLGVGWK